MKFPNVIGMDLRAIIDELVSLEALEESQSRVFHFLIQISSNQPVKASEIADALHMNRTFVYEVLDILHKRKLIDIVDRGPKRYIARDPKVFMKLHCQKLQNQIRRIEMLAGEWDHAITAHWKNSQNPQIEYERPSSCGLYFPPNDKRY